MPETSDKKVANLGVTSSLIIIKERPDLPIPQQSEFVLRCMWPTAVYQTSAWGYDEELQKRLTEEVTASGCHIEALRSQGCFCEITIMHLQSLVSLRSKVIGHEN
jgi:hypothetical protein